MNLAIFFDEDNIRIDRKTRKLYREFNPKMLISSMAVLFAFLAAFFPLFGNLSLFFAPGAVILGGIWIPNALLNWEIRRINSCVEPPHKLIENFERWDEGDRVELSIFDKTLQYKGVTDSHDLVFRWYGYQGNGKLFPLPPLFVQKTLDENPDARKRMIHGFDCNLRQEIEDSEYEKFLSHLKEEKENVKGGQKQEQFPSEDVQMTH